MDDIDSIGEVSLDDEELINGIMENYKTLTDNQKEQVNNENATQTVEEADNI